MRALLYAVLAVVVLVFVAPPGCRRMQERVLLSLVRESERPVEIVDGERPTFRFPPTAVRAVAVIDYDDATHPDGHVSFVPPDGSERYAWAVSVCPNWSTSCMEARPPIVLSEATYGTPPPGLQQIEPPSGPSRALVANRLYGLALFGNKLFALKMFYRDERGGVHVMDGSRFADAVVRRRRGEITAFLQHP